MDPQGVQRKLTAILSADVKGYSRLMSQDEVGTIRTLTAYRAAMATLIQQYRGRVVDAPGDNLLAEFASVVDAVNCAVEIQRELAERNVALPSERRMEFRIGVNLGDVVVEEGERIYGDGVNIAARVESLAEGGGICISGTAYDQVENKLGLEYDYLGEQAVKNIPKPVRVYRVLSVPGAAAHRVLQARRAVARKWRTAALAITAVLVLGGGTAAIWSFYLRPSPRLAEVASVEKMAFPLPDKPSIAVLPFDNLSDDPEQGYFVDGMTDDLITELSKVSGLFVIARNSVFTYKDKAVKVRQVAEELGVRYVLEGSARKAGERVRINAQLIDATTGHHLWAERYDGNLGDVFTLQDRITGKIVSALAVKLTAVERDQVARKHTDNVVAYDAFLQGRTHYVRRTPDDFAKAVRYFEKAIELDPTYGRAYAALALTYWEGSHNFWSQSLGISWFGARTQADEYLQMAMNNPTPLTYQVASKMLTDWHDHGEAIDMAERAIALDPNDANSYLAMAYTLIYAGRPEEAFKFVESAMRLDPHYPAYYLFVLGLAHFGTQQFEEAATLFERALKRNPINNVPLIHLAASYGHLGHEREAAAAIEELKKVMPEANSLTLASRPLISKYKNPLDNDRLLEGLRKAGLPETAYDALRKAREK
ncbi:MAG: adenylate/guanylate cyclase domain-containing protein [Candidatus Methylomirabilales bacterium]